MQNAEKETLTKRSRIRGDKYWPDARMTMHWINQNNTRMYWCNCMPAFRVGGKIHHPRSTKGTKAK